MTEAMGQVAAGAVPGRPFLLMGQMTTTDPTRSPTGTESLWAYTHVPAGVAVPATGSGLGRTTASGSPTGCRPGSSGWRRASAPGSWPAGCSGRASWSAATPT